MAASTELTRERTPDELAHAAATVRDAVAFLLRASQPTTQPKPKAYHLSPEHLDAINPLPNGYSRVQGRILHAPQAASERATGQPMADQVVG